MRAPSQPSRAEVHTVSSLPLRIVFMGTPDFSVPTLQRLVCGPHEVVAVVTQPDRPSGRRRRLSAPPVKRYAESVGLGVIQPNSLATCEVFDALAVAEPDLFVVVAYGQILRQRMLDLPRLGCLNVHASLLPRWRGAAPINWAIHAGDVETGVCVMQMERGLDTGPVLDRWRTPIGATETAGALHDRLAVAGAERLESVVGRIGAGDPPTPEPQDDSLATYARMLKKSDGRIDFTGDASAVASHIRSMTPWPGATCETENGPLKLCNAVAEASGVIAPRPPGTIVEATREGLVVSTGDGLVRVLSCQRPGRRVIDAGDYVSGYHGDLVGAVWR